ncbi:MAG: YdbH domain-containing protein [Aquimonas sp.]|nr:YdbH domain-containing protein [Aquimonas sp.]
MTAPISSRRLFAVMAALLLWLPGFTCATVLRAEAERIQQGPVLAEGVRLQLSSPASPGAGLGLRLEVDRLDMDGFGYRFQDLRWNCELRPRDVASWRCDGPLRAAGAAAGELSLDWTRGRTELSLVRGRMRLAAHQGGANPQGETDPRLHLRAERLPSGWLQPLLGELWEAARLTGGLVNVELAMEVDSQPLRLDGQIRVDGLGLDTQDGSIAAEGLNAQGRLRLELADQARVQTELALSGGEVLVGALYAALPAQPVQLQLALLGAADRWTLQRLLLDDPTALRLEASGRVDLVAEDWLPDLRLDLRSSRADLMLQRYLETAAGTLGFSGLQARGGLRLQLQKQAGAMQSIDFEPEGLALVDAAGRFEMSGAGGVLGWTADTSTKAGELTWSTASVYGLSLGAGRMQTVSTGGGFGLDAPMVLDVLGGALELQRLQWRPAAEEEASTRFDLALDLQGLDLGALSAAFGWPAFEGKLSGQIPGVAYRDGVLGLDGELRMQVFDGEVRIAGLRVERPFGVLPMLAADVEMARLDLAPLTRAFGFGEITGRMRGHIHALRLVDWEPIAFDARFETDPSASERRRISQRAVTDLSSVGGLGAAAALQQGMLRSFESFAYSRIGIACRLQRNVCHMDGVAPNPRGYTIVEGSGVPRITVNGIQRQVDWPVLVARLKAVTEGQPPRID